MKTRHLKNIRPMMKSNGDYEWKFSTIGGVTRVNVTSGQDIAHLDELDPKLWTVLSCPVSGLEMDAKTLAFIDTDKDGRIHTEEVVAASQWLVSVLSDLQILVDRCTSISLSAFRTDTENGRMLRDSAVQLLQYLGKDADCISIEDVANSLAAFAGTRFNGDGVITAKTPDDAELQKIVEECMSTVGCVPDKSGENGVNEELVEKFYAAASEWCARKEVGDADRDKVFPFGDRTGEALALCEKLSPKIEDYFLRCKLALFNGETSESLDVSKDRISTVADKNLTGCVDEISSFPLSHVSKDCLLNISEGVNPVWSADVELFRELVAAKMFPCGSVSDLKDGSQAVSPELPDALSEHQWNEIKSVFSPYRQHLAEEKGAEVKSLGYDRLKAIADGGRKAELIDLISQDKSLESRVAGFESVEKLLYLTRDFYTLVRNYVTFSDFYASSVTGVPAVFQVGRLFIDQRCCDLCMDVADTGKHNAMAAASGMFLIYCDCVSRHDAGTKKIVAVMTDGDINNLKVGKNAIFYDRAGRDWDATVTKIVDNPISLRQSFWSPYRKMGNFIEQQITKFAADQDKKVTDKSLASLSSAGTSLAATAKSAENGAPVAAAEQPKQQFDIAKYCGLFAMVGMALGTIGSFVVNLFTEFFKMSWWQMPLVILAIMLIISGPAMLLDWLKIRKRNLSPILNANGWAINARLAVNVRFGTSLTHIARTPLVVTDDPFADKKVPVWKKILVWTVVVIGLTAAIYFTIPKESRPFWKTASEAAAPCASSASSASSASTASSSSFSDSSQPSTAVESQNAD